MVSYIVALILLFQIYLYQTDTNVLPPFAAEPSVTERYFSRLGMVKRNKQIPVATEKREVLLKVV